MSAPSFTVVSLRGPLSGLDDGTDAASGDADDGGHHTAVRSVGPLTLVEIDPAAGADDIVAGIAGAQIVTPWILVVGPAQHELAAEVVDRVLAGALGVFGLAGVVGETDAASETLRHQEVPVAAVPVGAPAGAPDIAAAVRGLAADIAAWGPRVPDAWARVIASDRTDVAVRSTLARRALADDPSYSPRALSTAQLSLLRDVARRIIPQGEGPGIDLAARVDRMVAAGESDGWRPTGMSTDVETYRTGLDALAGVWMRSAAGQDRVIRDVIDQRVPSGDVLTPGQLALWFEDARNDLARVWLSHPASLARVGYSGFATGGTGAEPAGYLVLAAGEREEWEPDELGRLAAAEGHTS